MPIRRNRNASLPWVRWSHRRSNAEVTHSKIVTFPLFNTPNRSTAREQKGCKRNAEYVQPTDCFGTMHIFETLEAFVLGHSAREI